MNKNTTSQLYLILLMVLILTPLIANSGLRPDVTISKADGEQCVLPSDEIRKVHPDLLKHDRIATLRHGVRTEDSGKSLKGSLKKCISCHAIKDKGEYIHVDNPKHFCTSCHVFAGVSFDCFQCHRDTPEK